MGVGVGVGGRPSQHLQHSLDLFQLSSCSSALSCYFLFRCFTEISKSISGFQCNDLLLPSVHKCPAVTRKLDRAASAVKAASSDGV